MKLLIAVKSCQEHRRLGFHKEIMKTWGKDFQTDVTIRFFTGGIIGKDWIDYLLVNEEESLFCNDGYDSLPEKTRRICQWAISADFDFVFLCDTDTYINREKLLTSGFENYDYFGKIDKPFGQTFPYKTISRDGIEKSHEAYPWASGGYGYFLSRKAFNIIVKSEPEGWAEDFWVGQILGPLYNIGEIKMQTTPGREFSWHFPSHEYKSGYDLSFNWMQEMHEAHR